MFKKCIATYVSLLMILLPFSTALAAPGNKLPVLDEKKLVEKLIANAPFKMPALGKNQALNTQAVQRAAQELLVLLDENDGALSLLLDQAKVIKPAADIKQMLKNNLIRLAAAGDPVAGCQTPYVFASLEFWAVAPVTFIYAIDNLIYNTKEPDCGLMYVEWWLATVFTSLAIYDTYYICAENTKATPDQSLIANYESDRTTMRLLAALFYVFYGLTYGYCPNALFNLEWDKLFTGTKS
jgi:hypothetical protein